MMNLKLPTHENCFQSSPKFRLEQIIINNSETARINLSLDSTTNMTSKMLFSYCLSQGVFTSARSNLYQFAKSEPNQN